MRLSPRLTRLAAAAALVAFSAACGGWKWELVSF
jgi:hypothetical protein